MLYGCDIIPGVYQIRSKTSGKRYIGSSVNIYARWDRHQQDLRYGTHHALPLVRAAEKYGIDDLEFSILLVCPPEQTREYEQRLLDGLKPEYNASKTASGVTHDEAARKKISDACKVAWSCPERRAKQSARVKAAMTPEAAEAFAAMVRSPENVAKVKAAHRARNRRYEAFGRLWALKELAEEHGVKYNMLKA